MRMRDVRLGRYDGIAAVVNDFVTRALGDPRIARFFAGHSADSMGRFRQHVTEQASMVTGGPCVYTGRRMKASHAGLGVTEQDWDLTVKYLGASLKGEIVEK
jgi:hemoglobin